MATKAKEIIKSILANPRSTNKTLARRFKVTTTYVQRLRRENKLPSPNGFRPRHKQLTLNLQPKVVRPAPATAAKVVRREAAPVQPPLPPKEAVDELRELLASRGSQYGNFMAGADTVIKIKQVLHRRIADRNLNLFPDQLLALDMIATKLGRIVNGNYNNSDSWKDIAGYAKLVSDRLEGKLK